MIYFSTHQKSWHLLNSFCRLSCMLTTVVLISGEVQGQLNKLMQRLDNTAPHFIRCIKPNRLQLPNIFEQDLVMHQLRCCGVLEVVRISRSGFPSRHLHQNFANRFIVTPISSKFILGAGRCHNVHKLFTVIKLVPMDITF